MQMKRNGSKGFLNTAAGILLAFVLVVSNVPPLNIVWAAESSDEFYGVTDEELEDARQEFFNSSGSSASARRSSSQGVILIDGSNIIHKPQEYLQPEPPSRLREAQALTDAGPFEAGDTRDFVLSNTGASGGAKTINAKLIVQGDHTNVWVLDDDKYHAATNTIHDNDCHLDDITTPYAQSIADSFDTIYGKMTTAFAEHECVVINAGFGNMPTLGDLGEDGKVNFVLYDINGDGGTDGGYTAGFFSNGDFFTGTSANALDMLHIDIGAGQGFDAFGADEQDSDRLSAYGTLAHEFQHMLFYMYYGVNMNSNYTGSSTWINETLSGIAEAFYTTNAEIVDMDRLRAASQNTYETNPPDAPYSDFLNHAEFKNYGMERLFGHMMRHKYLNFEKDIYDDIRQSYPVPSSSAELQDNMDNLTNMDQSVGDFLEAATGVGTGGLNSLSLLYYLFMESFAADGGQIYSSDFSSSGSFEKAYSETDPIYNLWAWRPVLGKTGGKVYQDSSNVSYISTSSYEAIPDIDDDGSVTLEGYGSSNGKGASHEMLYNLVEDSNGSTVLNITAPDDVAQAQYYVALMQDDVVSGEYSSGANGAALYPLKKGEQVSIETDGKDAYLFVSTLYGDVNSTIDYSWSTSYTATVKLTVDGTAPNTTPKVALGITSIDTDPEPMTAGTDGSYTLADQGGTNYIFVDGVYTGLTLEDATEKSVNMFTVNYTAAATTGTGSAGTVSAEYSADNTVAEVQGKLIENGDLVAAGSKVTFSISKTESTDTVTWSGVTFTSPAIETQNIIYTIAIPGPIICTTSAEITAPLAPADFTATAGDAEVALSWTAPNDGGSPILKYQLLYGPTATYAAADWKDIADSGTAPMTYTVEGLTNGTEYTFEVRAVNAIGDGETSGKKTATPTEAPAEPTAPLAPTSFTATAGDAEATLKWTAAGNGGSAILRYQLSYDPTANYAAKWIDMPNSNAATTSYIVDGLTNDTEYTFEVRAVNAKGEGATSGTKTATPTAVKYTVIFNSMGGSSIPDATVVEDAPVTKPVDPTRQGYTFAGWYTEEGLVNPYDFNTPVTKGLTLYAKWSEDVFKISGNVTSSSAISGVFDPVGGASVTLASDAAGSAVIKETTAAADGSFVFEGLAAGTYYLFAEADDYSPAGPIPVIITDKDAVTEIPMALVILPPGSLRRLSAGGYNMTPAFDPTVHSYTLTVGNSVSSLSISAVPADLASKVSGRGPVNLAVGANTVKVTVLAPDGTEVTYTIIITRNKKSSSSNNNGGGGSSTGSGSSGGSSSGSTPSTNTPTPSTPEPDATVIVDGRTENVGTVSVTDGLTLVDISQSSLLNQIENAQQSVSIPVSGLTTDRVAVQLVLQSVEAMTDKGVTLSIEADGVNYAIPAGAINAQLLRESLSASEGAEIPVQININKNIGAERLQAVKTAVALTGAELISSPIEFTINAEYGGNTVNISTFDRFTARTFEVEPEDAERITTALVVEENGKLRHVPTFVYYKDGKAYAQINSRTNSTYVFVSNEIEFPDVVGSVYQDDINEMASRRIVAGRTPQRFDGEANITRAEFASIIVNALGLPSNGKADMFSDISADSSFYGVIGTAYEYGIINGRDNGTFDPNSRINWQEAGVIMYYAAKAAGFNGTSAPAYNLPEGLSDWAADEYSFCAGSGLFPVSADAQPEQLVTREEMSSTILNLLRKAELVDIR